MAGLVASPAALGPRDQLLDVGLGAWLALFRTLQALGLVNLALRHR
jgi:hypothetical protein